MKIEIEIPKEFELEFNSDKFSDFFGRVIGDMNNSTDYLLCGNYERETATMLKTAFKKSIVKGE